MDAIYQAAANTPWWVYALLIYLIIVGIKASKTRVVSLKKLFIIPAFFVYMSIHTLLNSVTIDIFSLSIWSGSILFGTLIGWMQITNTKVKVDRKKNLVEIEGTWTTLIYILIIFTTKYFFGYELAVDPELARQTTFEFALLATSGICTGLFVGKLLCCLNLFYKLPSTELNEIG